MFLYFEKRLLHKKNFYLALLVGTILSVLYVINDVYPYRDLKYGHSVYTIWMGSFTGSVYASLFYLILPLLVALPMADTWLSDRQRGYYEFILTRNKKKQYFSELYICNFVTGGIISAFPLLLNLYMCFLLIPDKKPDFILWETHIVTLYGKEALFPRLFYDAPLLHVILSVCFAFLIGGLLASVALAFSCVLKNIFMVWISAFVLNFLYESVVGIVCKDGAGTYDLLTYAHQVAPSGKMELPIFAMMTLLILIVTIVSVYWGAKTYELE